MPYNQPRRQPWETEEEEAHRQQMLAEEAAQMQAMTQQPPGPPPSGPYTSAPETLPQATPGALDPRAIQSPANNPILMARLAGVDDAMEAHAGSMDEFAQGEEPKGFMKNFASKGLPALLAAAATGGFAIPMALAFGLGAAQEDQRLQTRAQREAKLKASEGKVDLAQIGFENAQDVHSPSGRNEPAELQVWRELTQGLGQDDYNRALRQRLHLDPRPGTTSWGTVIATGADGRKRVLQHSRTTGQFATPDGRPMGNPAQWKVVYDFDTQSMDPDALDDPSFDWGGDPPPVLSNDPVPQGEELAESIAGGPNGGPGTQAPPNQGTPVPGQGMPQNRPPETNTQVGGVDFFTSRTPEEEKYASELAQRQAEREMPTPPPDFRYDENNRLVPIPGSPTERSETLRRKATQERMRRVVPTVLRSVTRGIELANAAGPFRGQIADVTGEGEVSLGRKLAAAATGDTFELVQHLEDMKSNISIDALQEMRTMSPTGGALGQIPVRQQEYLMSIMGSLKAGLPPEVLQENLAFVGNEYLRLMLESHYGDDQDLHEAVADGKMDQTTADRLRAERDELYAEHSRELKFGMYGDVKPEAPASDIPPAPAGWEEDWLFLTEEERARITGDMQ